ncbi:MAG TPA: iron-containing redox enzyme family protein [Chloroflexota bacterium]|nr:iron-containing redox enzyme family protein [Chloroflexota bacterium]
MALAPLVDALQREIVELANEQFETEPLRRLFAVRFSKERARHYTAQMTFYVMNRRDCWGHVQGAAPLDVKRLIWEHEGEELMGDRTQGKKDHIALAAEEGQIFGLTADGFAAMRPTDTAQACFWAWIHLAKSRPWLQALAASTVPEMTNSDAIIRGGGTARRMATRWEADLNIPIRKQVSHAEHLQADMSHASMLFKVAEQHVRTEYDRELVLRGARETLAINRVFRGQLAAMLEELPL